ncbi:aldo/keto reductase [Paractinoplanes atraurantiacus]|uniref:Predicted oxidoreductase n=1 Tax=Paractinoplanes atraurantiacus TaxID=1036182 RepID=A0A285KSY4_9ACTN|nr:aldo/keto reductase [Actinoplanes atraurantiacus]SNY74516.1 Predicted oxidoreductase [Actinoplanes atraurantiacus]
MRYTLLGRSGLRVSEFALGTMTFGDNWGWGAPVETSARMLELYADAGGNFVDTANAYTAGVAETTIGHALRGRRDRFVLGTKYTLQTEPGDLNTAGNHRKNLIRSLEASLRRLRTDYVDVLWVHARDVLTPVPELMRALDDQVRAGKVLHVGVSDWPAWEIAQANTVAELRGWSPFIGVQLRYNLLSRTVESELTPMARAHDLAVLAWGPLAEGRLTGKYLDGGQGRVNRGGWDFSGDRGDHIVREVVSIAAAGGWTPAQVALAWLRSRPGTVIPLLGATSEQQLRANLGAADIVLGDDVLRRLDQVSAPPPTFPHDVMAGEDMTSLTYGDQWRHIDDRRLPATTEPR